MVKINEENKKLIWKNTIINIFKDLMESMKKGTCRGPQYKNGNYKKEPNRSFRTENYSI